MSVFLYHTLDVLRESDVRNGWNDIVRSPSSVSLVIKFLVKTALPLPRIERYIVLAKSLDFLKEDGTDHLPGYR